MQVWLVWSLDWFSVYWCSGNVFKEVFHKYDRVKCHIHVLLTCVRVRLQGWTPVTLPGLWPHSIIHIEWWDFVGLNLSSKPKLFFLSVFQPEESSSSPRPTPAQPPPTAPPAPQPVPAAISQSSLTQEQLIRQQLLAKQKQLLELQQKKIELELEQTKAQLVRPPGAVRSPLANHVSASQSRGSDLS